MITSCSPGWINFCETFYSDLLDNISTCKSPQQMFGAKKTYWAEKTKINPADIFSVSIMPCVAKKHEATRPNMDSSGYRDVDLVLTTRELGRLLRVSGVDFSNLSGSDFDSWMGTYTGAGVFFGASGGVSETALRSAYELYMGEQLDDINFRMVRGMKGIKEAEVDIKDLKVKVGVGHGLNTARRLLEQVRRGESPYHFIEIMACPGRCIGGGG